MNKEPTDLQTAWLETTWGEISIVAGRQGVTTCNLPQVTSKTKAFRVIRERLPREASRILRQAVDFTRALLEGRAPKACPAIDPAVFKEATAFRRAIWVELCRIPRGRTATYAQLAQRAGHPRAARAAGNACGANPIPLFIPCHRALAAGGALGGFSCGVAWKVQLLTGEGVAI